MPFPTTFHDVLDPLTGQRVDLVLDAGRRVGPTEGGRHLDGSALWVLPALYDADAHMPLVDVGLRSSDAAAALAGGVARVNVALQWQDIVGHDLEALVADLTRWSLPEITPILSVHSDRDSAGYAPWLAANAELVKALLPPVCKLYSYGDGFWDNLDTVFGAGLLPIIYCKDFSDVEAVVAKASGPVHFRHAMTEELVDTMKGMPGATLQTSPHFLLPVADDVRERLFVLPPVADAATCLAFAGRVMDDIDLVVTDHNAPPMHTPTGPGLQVQQHFLPALLSAAELHGWPLEALWAKATSAPAARFGVALADSFVLVDPEFRQPVGLWQPRQTPDRAPFAGMTLRGRVLAVGNDREAVLL